MTEKETRSNKKAFFNHNGCWWMSVCRHTKKIQHKQFRVLADKTTQPVSSSSDSDELNSKRGLVGKYKLDEWV